MRVHTVGEGHREETWQLRAVWLKSERYQLIGKSDLIESADSQVIQSSTSGKERRVGQ